MNRNYTILGATGFIGHHLAVALRDSGVPVSCPNRKELQFAGMKNLGHVFYSLGGDNWADDPFGAVDAHVGHLRRLLEYGRFESLTYISSTRLYLGAASGSEDSALVVDYGDAGRLHNALKLVGEALCLASNRAEVRVIRLSNVIGFAPRGISFIPALIKNAISTGEMDLWIAPESAKDYVAIDDVAGILPRICENGRHRLYNVAGGKNITAASIVACIEAATHAKATWHKGETMNFPPISIDRVQQEFQFKPRAALEVLPAVCGQFKNALFKATALT